MHRAALLVPTIALVSALSLSSTASAQSLRGSSASLTRQNHQAHSHDFSFLRTGSQVNSFVEKGLLVRVRSNADVTVNGGVSFPYARPEVRLFVERLGAQYRRACGEKLVVTSLTRPLNRQPANASDRSVHPTGMALDLRRSKKRACTRWLDGTLLSLERAGIIEATLERRPPHYHVAVFPSPYRRYVSRMAGGTERLASATKETVRDGSTAATYRVNRGDTLWDIARKHGLSVDALKLANNLRGGRIMPGQTLTLPAR